MYFESDVNAAYIAAPVVICVIALLLILGFIWWRKRKTGPSVWHKKGKTNSLILNVVNGENGTTGNGSSVDIRQSTVNEYTEIALDQMNPDKTTGDNYQTIDILAEDNVCANKSYSNVIQSDSKAINAKYSHIDINQTQKIKHSNNTYAHTRSANVSDKPEMEIEYEDDETYNRLNTTTLKTNKVKEDEDTEYNHAHSGAKDLENNQNESDNYSHLANGRKTPHESAKTSERIHAANGNIDSDIGQLSKSGIETPTDYELAKDFDNLKGSSEMPEFTNATKKTSDFNKMSAENNGNETDSGKDHNYSILEPEAATNAMSFHVVEDELDVTVEQMEGIKSHEYFILEKTNT